MKSKTRTLIAMLIGGLLACATMAMSPAQHADAADYRYISHRGVVNSKYKGNTVPAFKQAAATTGIWGIETDIYRTKDGHFVCLHGSDGVTTWKGMKVANTNLSALRAKKDGSYVLPTLEEFLAACKAGGKVAVIEFKDKQFNSTKSYAEAVVKVVKKAGMLNKSTFISFQHKGVNWAQNYAKSQYKVTVPSYALASNSQSAVNTAVDDAKSYGLTGVSVHYNQVDYAKKRLAAKGVGTKKIQAWTYGSEAAARTGISKGLYAATGEFTPAQYTVTYKDGVDSKVLKTQKVLYGASASAPGAPAHAGKTFTGWSRASSNITGNTTITANYSTNKYTVTFKDGVDGKTLKSQTVEHGKAATAPSAPAHTGYKFSKWDKTYSSVTGNLVVTASYTANIYTVTFKDGVDGKTLKTQTVTHGQAATAPSAPAHAGKTFSGWSRALTNITGNTTITANYAVAKYTVTFKDGIDGKTLKTQTVEHDKAASAPSAPAHAGRTFSKWDKAYSSVTSNITVTALYNINKYTVTFKDSYDGKVLKTETVEHGKSATAPSAPSHTGKTFSGWSRTMANITANTTIVANYAGNSYNVTFKDGRDGSIIATAVIEHGKYAQAPTPPAHDGYRFSRWDRALGPITAATTITALYDEAAKLDSLISIRNAQVIDKSGAVMISKKSSYPYDGGKPVCPVASLRINGKTVDKSNLVCYYYKNNRRGTASVIIKGVNSKGYKDSMLVSYKIK